MPALEIGLSFSSISPPKKEAGGRRQTAVRELNCDMASISLLHLVRPSSCSCRCLLLLPPAVCLLSFPFKFAQEPSDRVVVVIDHALLQRNDSVVRDVNVF